jgi:hypothetical protein
MSNQERWLKGQLSSVSFNVRDLGARSQIQILHCIIVTFEETDVRFLAKKRDMSKFWVLKSENHQNSNQLTRKKMQKTWH